jgi:hypothetical protein
MIGGDGSSSARLHLGARHHLTQVELYQQADMPFMSSIV